jgi:Lanthionine-containing peptide SapB precursor RamS
MSILDLQGLDWKEENGGSGGNSHGSHGCGGGGGEHNSTLSILCEVL